MSTTRRIDIALYGRDDDLKEKISALKLMLDRLKDDAKRIPVDVNDDEAKVKLLDLQLKLDRISDKVARPSINLRGADHALLQLAKVQLAMDGLSENSSHQSLISHWLNGSGNNGSSGILGAIAAPGESPGALALAGAGVGAAVFAIAGAVTELAALSTGIVAAGLGIGSLVALAVPAFTKISAAMGDSPKQLKKLPPAIQDAVHDIHGLESGFDKISKALQPQMFKIFNQGLGIATKLMPDLGKFANAAAPAVDHLLGALSKNISGAGFQGFINQMLRLTGPAITAIGHGIGELGAQFGVLMSKFSQKNVINAINIAFKILDVTMGGVIRMVQNAMNWWDEMSAAVKNTRNWVNDAIKEFGILRHETANIFDGIKQDVSRIWDQMWNATVSADVHGVSRVVSEIGRLPGQAIHAIASLPGMMRSAGANAMNWLLGGIESAASRVLSFISGIGGEIAAHLRSALSVSIPGIGHIGFAQGGVIDEPIVGFGLRSGMSYSFGEDGPETITPGTGHYGGGGGGDTYIINVPESATNPDQYGLRLIQVIRDYKRHHGNAATGIG